MTRFLGNLPLPGRNMERRKRKRKKPGISREELSSNISVPLSQDLKLEEWGLPEEILKGYKSRGISQMFPWQAECLQSGEALGGKNLVYSAPTSAGKTLVAEILLLKRVLEFKKKGILILPFVSLAREKFLSLQDLLKGVNLRVEGFMGSQGHRAGLKMADVAVCTIEKANSLINRCIEQGNLQDIGIVVVDELHLVGDSSRGYLLELMLTKILFIAKEAQIVGMSATLPNLDLIATWLDADLYVTDYRPVPLTEMVKVDNVLYTKEFKFVKLISSGLNINDDSDNLIQLCLETVIGGHSVLVFCPTKSWCERVAEAIAKEFYNLGKSCAQDNSERSDICGKIRSELDGTKLKNVIENLRRTPAGLDIVLGKTIAFAVAFHHAGLTMDERDIVENSFKQGVLRVLVATSTLSSGVNLPARRVIVRSPFTFQNRLIDVLSYRQMIGRAGRKGIDTEGESILFCRESERSKVEQLIKSDLDSVSSCLITKTGEGLCASMKRAILEIIVGKIATTKCMIEKYASCTLLAASLKKGHMDEDFPPRQISNCVDFLEKNEFIRIQELNSETRYVATQLGLACLASSLSPDEGLLVFEELQKARKCFVLENEMHIVYLLVPIYAAVSWPNLDWMNYLTIWESLSGDVKRVGEIVGIEERFLIRAMRGTINFSVSKQAKCMAIHQRFYTAMALNDLINEVPLIQVSKKYGASKGMLQSLQQTASTFAGMVTVFCGKLGWCNLELLVSQFQNRLQFGVQRELVDLCRLSTLNGQRARALFNSSFDSVADLAGSSYHAVENALINACPFESGKRFDGESEYETEERSKLRTFWITGMKDVTVKKGAQMIVDEARSVLQKDLGVDCNWEGGIKTIPPKKRSNTAVQSKDMKPQISILKIPETKANRQESRPLSVLLSTEAEKSPIFLESSKSSSLKRKSAFHKPKEEAEVEPHEASFDISSIIDEIFEEQEFTAVKNRSKKGVPFENDKSSMIDLFENDEDDIFFDTWNMQEENVTNVSKKTSINTSCPKTPMYDVCSEELDLHLSSSSEVEDKDIQDSVLSDSFLERAFNTHMSAEENESVVEDDNKSIFGSENKDKGEEPPTNNDMDSPKMSLWNRKDAFNIIDVCSSREILKEFVNEVKTINKPIAFTIAASKAEPNLSNIDVIGKRFTRKMSKEIRSLTENKSRVVIKELSLQIDGVAFSWGDSNNDVFYLNLYNDSSQLNDTICPPSFDSSISDAERLIALKDVFNENNTYISFDVKEQLRCLFLGLDIWFSLNGNTKFKDPKIGAWLLNPGGKEKSLPSLVMEFASDLAPILKNVGVYKGCGSVGLAIDSTLPSRNRALTEVLLIKHVMYSLEKVLHNKELLQSFVNVEMPSLPSFLCMELNGVGFSEEESNFQRKLIVSRMEELEIQAYDLAGRTFSLTSPEDTSRVLYLELGLPPNGEPNLQQTHPRAKYKTLLTSKEVLIKLQAIHELPKIILEWRKLNASITKVVFPMQRKKVYHSGLKMGRIYTHSLTHTSTGRISLAEPNIQNIPKDFEIKTNISIEESFNRSVNKVFDKAAKFLKFSSEDLSYRVSMRHAVVSSEGSLIIAADYSQLELRILAHISGDEKLRSILNDGQDVFKLIASRWKRKTCTEVTDEERQSAKQMCYGILYGIGAKALGEQLGVPTEEASVFMMNFKDTFPGIRRFIDDTISECRSVGFVKTMTGRRRYLPNIKTSMSTRNSSHIISHAERQAVNTRVQGSAADLVKMAMININQSIANMFPGEIIPLAKESHKPPLAGGYFILQIHDELLFEASSKHVFHIAGLIKDGMEKACTLSVKTPVNVKVGPSWGTLKSYVV